MLSKEQWLLAENGDNSIGYTEFERITRALISTYSSLIFSIFIYYTCFLYLHWLFVAKIIICIINVLNIIDCLTIPLIFYQIFNLHTIKNKWLRESQFVLIHTKILSFICVACCIWFVLLEHPLPNFLVNGLAFILILIYLFWFKQNLITYKNTNIPNEWLERNGFIQKNK